MNKQDNALMLMGMLLLATAGGFASAQAESGGVALDSYRTRQNMRYELAQQNPDATQREEAASERTSSHSRDKSAAATRNPEETQTVSGVSLYGFTPQQEPPSALEKMYAGRVVDELQQFGYDLFGVPQDETRARLDRAAPSVPAGTVRNDYILSVGDELEVMFSGQRSDRKIYRVDSNGLILIEDMPPIPAAGRAIGQVRVSIEAAANNLHNTQAYVVLANVRQIGILVVGHVKRPGSQTSTVFHTVLDALMEAGGVDKTGSLRQIKLVRDGRSTIVDLYSLLMYAGNNVDLQLRDGDRIIVPPIGPTVAVAGEVKRPGIYEIPAQLQGMFAQADERSAKLSLNEILEMAGGTMTPGKTRFMKLEITSDGKDNAREVSDSFAPLFGDGSILMVSKGQDRRSGTVELEGHTPRPGLFTLEENPTLGKLLRSDDMLGSDVYPLLGVIEHWDEDQMARVLIDFPVRLVRKGSFDRKLENGDRVLLFSNEQIRLLQEMAAQKSIAQGADAPVKQPSFGSSEDGPEDARNGAEADGRPDKSLLQDKALLSFLQERASFVRGAVRNPGPYPVAEGARLDNLIAAAGGLTLEADPSNVEITSASIGEGLPTRGHGDTRRNTVNLVKAKPDSIRIAAGDSVRIGQKFSRIEDKSVLVMGEVLNPGRYDLEPGDKISDLLRRAGGLTPQAYAPGAIFSRSAERKAEETRFRAQSRSIKQAIAQALGEAQDKIDSAKIAEARALATELENAQGIGRITVEADPAALKTRPELDMLLEAGDRLFIPKRSLSVRVSGEVLSPATLQFRDGKNPREYLDEAGGLTYNADPDRSFVLYPNGSAQPLQVSSWNYNPVFIPPGSTIVVPRDPKPFDFIESARDISQILSNLAVTAIFIDDVRNGD